MVRLAEDMYAAWIAFASGENPGWPSYDLDRRPVMRFDTTSQVVNDPKPAERTIWDGVFATDWGLHNAR
ncbi:hypothetical protein [Amycolatopsis taiwanensis]|uniref:Carboxylesterase type B domain-containing protein n=1 Tax=Amycolatopsis taiwanensis TaxID=342230 RepID=A0A9W6VL25_9PSEU|nr:hypothetical protein [Amycolatopsis taiwanensis]GLY70086.1 hypothetical protein Atai01_67050 [Amycolatopsis taiwanensis]